MTVASNYAIDMTKARRDKAVEDACATIAPNWPLDKMIAVNPYWELKDNAFSDVAAELSVLADIHSLMPAQYWLSLYQEGQISHEALEQAAKQFGFDPDVEQLVEALSVEPGTTDVWLPHSALLDKHRDHTQISWHDEIIQQISQFCAAYFQTDKGFMAAREDGHGDDAMYRSWLANIQRDKGISILMGEPGLEQQLSQLPDNMDTLLAEAEQELALDRNHLNKYFQGMLLSVNGWAAFIAYRRWQKEGDEMSSLLAIRVAWELVIWRQIKARYPDTAKQVIIRWGFEQSSYGAKLNKQYQRQQRLWLWFVAYELSEQNRFQRMLLKTPQHDMSEPAMQAVFCIDVRSEVIRRALESQNDRIQTCGFAGFFGMPLAYEPLGTKVSRPQLPGLLQPRFTAVQRRTELGKVKAIGRSAGWQRWSKTPTGGFSMVEAAGWWYGFKMLKQMWFPSKVENPVSSLTHESEWELKKDQQPLSVQDKAELAAGVLGAMGIKAFAPIVLLVGHASHTTNNLHAAGLDCGACGGQSGEVNVRVLTGLLNDKSVRAALKEQGIGIPMNTRFVAALHNTTTDDIRCFDDGVTDKVLGWLESAKHAAQRERAGNIDRSWQHDSDRERDARFQQRSNDWSQVRPEWGLANNGAFVIAPRYWTRNANLEGRAFLHDYHWRQDADFNVLELLMTAPMIVTNWINMQYNASVTDNRKFGSGNKVLHNAVDGNIGVFEGNTGDLRIGLSRQSLHNGDRWMHQPQRLSVYICAPKHGIADIVEKHEMVKQLIDNDWLYLFCWDKPTQIERLYKGKWYVAQGLTA